MNLNVYQRREDSTGINHVKIERRHFDDFCEEGNIKLKEHSNKQIKRAYHGGLISMAVQWFKRKL